MLLSTRSLSTKPAAKKLFLALAAAALLAPSAAQARNLDVESGLRSLADLSDFYHALVYTGVANELQDGQPYTILAPTNAAMATLDRQAYPCFYQSQCHEMSASFVRAHILVGRYPLQAMVRDVSLQTDNSKEAVEVQEPYVGQYQVNGQDILNQAEIGNSIIYRINGLVIPNNYLSVFQTTSYAPPDAVTTRTTTTYVEPVPDTEVDSQPVIIPGVNANSTTVQKTVTRTYVPDPGW